MLFMLAKKMFEQKGWSPIRRYLGTKCWMLICNAINMIDWLCDCALIFIIVFMLYVCRKGHSSLQPSSPGAFSFSKIVSDKELGSFKQACFSI